MAKCSRDDQLAFVQKAIEIFSPVFEKYCFTLFIKEVKEYGTELIWIKGNCYVTLSSNTHPHDAPYHYGICVGQFDSKVYRYADKDIVGLWRMKITQDPSASIDDTPFPFKDDITASLHKTKDDLLKYGYHFLEGDLDIFYKARNIQWNKDES